MKTLKIHILSIFVLFCAFTMSSCSDNCTQTNTYRKYSPIQIGVEQLKNSIKNQSSRAFEEPGKIYSYGIYLLVAEVKKGVHIIDNANPSNPKNIGFLTVPGILDMAIKDDVLYVDNYTDLVAIDITNISQAKEISRFPGRFNYGLHDGISWYYDPISKVITDYEGKLVTETMKVSCDGNGSIYPVYYSGGLSSDQSGFKSGTSSSSPSTGTGGSMARFTVYNEYLYAATQSDLLVFSIANKAKVDSVNKVNLGWGIETIFPYNNKLFIGSNTGMHIYDNKNPKNPTRLSIFQHARACDPVVVQGNLAYVTLRQGWCGAAPNRLDVVDITNLTTPFIKKSYEMQNPHGLSIDNKKLMICEGKFGLKSYDASDPLNISLQQHIKDVQAYDVIQLPNNVLVMIGKSGLYQYDNSDLKNMKLLSSIKTN